MAIKIIVGPPGAGKTYTMVSMLLDHFRAEKPMVYSNMANLRCPEYCYVEAVTDFETISRGVVLLDEAGVFFGSRNWQQRTQRQIAAFAQVRKDGLDLWCTTQHENRVDTILRENASEYVRCRRVGPMIIAESFDPHVEVKERRQGRRFFLLRDEIYDLYDTFERIGETGGTAGSGPQGALRLSTVARRVHAAKLLAKAERERKKQIRNSIFRAGDRTLELTREAREVKTWLLEMGLGVVCGRVSLRYVQAELNRRRWLKVWNLNWSDAPYDCDENNPWLSGFDPITVEKRNLKAKMQENAEALIDSAEQIVKRGSGGKKARF